MNFSSQSYLHLLWILIPLIILILYGWKRGDRFGRKEGRDSLFIAGRSSLLKSRRIISAILFLTAFILMAIAMAGPRWGFKERLVEKKGIDIVVAIDLSRSMLSEDITPNRLERARMELASFIDSRRGDRIGIVAFAGSAIVACPLTMDYGAAKNFLRGLRAGMIPVQGTALASAINVSVDLMKGYGGREKVIVLLTDGEDTVGKPIEAAEAAVKAGAAIYSIGFGTKKGAPIPIYDKNGKIADYKKDDKGNTVVSKLETRMLTEIAEKGRGLSFFGANAISEIQAELEKRDKQLISSKMYTFLEERFQYPLFIAFLLLSIEALMRERRVR